MKRDLLSELDGPRGGQTFVAEFDMDRLNRQARAVFRCMLDGRWRSLRQISEITGEPEASVSARLRDFRKDQFGSHTVDRRRHISLGLNEYRLMVNEKD